MASAKNSTLNNAHDDGAWPFSGEPAAVNTHLDACDNVYRAAKNLFFNVKRRLHDIEAMWELYSKQGLVPETDVFKNLKTQVEQETDRLDVHHVMMRARLESFPPVTTLEELLEYPTWDLDDAERVVFNEVTKLIFNKIQLYSEALTYLTQHINSRAGTLASSEATHGSNLAMHRFSGVQAVYDAAESLMSDYALDNQNETSQYKGLVVFGYNYSAAAWKGGLTTFPLFAEHISHLPMLVVLAHEAAHVLQGSEPLQTFRERLTTRFVNLVEQEYGGASFVPLLGRVSVDTHSRFHPVNSANRRLAGEIASDVFATLIGGPAYPRILARYFMPLFVDTVMASENPAKRNFEDMSWAFHVSSFKLRIATETAFLADYIDEPEYRAIMNYARRSELTLADAALKYPAEENGVFRIPGGPILEAALHEALGLGNGDALPHPEELLSKICQNTEKLATHLIQGVEGSENPELKPNIKELFLDCTAGRYELYNLIDAEIEPMFRNEVNFQELLTLWNDHPTWKPRHLISLLAPRFDGPQRPTVNNNAIILALSHHRNILNRYPAIHA